jgi:4-amino-4-deoxy-L-arabinose transferase-like glycosyltransferase
VELLAALVLGSLAAFARPWRRGPPTEPPRLRLAMGVALALWLLPGVFVFSKVEGLHPRYLEIMAPAVAGVLGVGIAGLGRLPRDGLLVRIAAALAVLGVCVYLAPIEPGPAGVVTWVAAAAACAALIVPGLPRFGRSHLTRHAPAIGAVLAAVALLTVPAARATHLIDTNTTDAGRLGAMDPGYVAKLSAYLAPRTRGIHWEVAASNYLIAPSLVIQDARPVMVLASVNALPIVTVSKLSDAVRSGTLRYALIGGSCGVATHIESKPHCLPAVRWVRTHGVDVTREAGIKSPGLLFRLRAGGLTGSQRGASRG